MVMINPEYFKQFEPPRDLLDQCYQVLILDPVRPWEMKQWAREHCQSYIWMEEVDVSDVSYRADIICCFYFGKEQDKMLFTIKYKD